MFHICTFSAFQLLPFVNEVKNLSANQVSLIDSVETSNVYVNNYSRKNLAIRIAIIEKTPKTANNIECN